MISASSNEDLGVLPSYKLKKLNGELVDVASYGENGRPTIISFWATWCKPCLSELNAIADYYEDYDKSNFLKLFLSI